MSTWLTRRLQYCALVLGWLLVSLSLVPATRATQGDLTWVKGAGSSSNDAGNAVAALPDGGVVVTGGFDGTATFAPGVALTSAGGWDIFIARYNANGSLAWVKRAGGALGDEGHGIAALADGGAIVTGEFMGTATFASGVSLSAAGGKDIFVARYDANGMVVWARRAGGAGDDVGLDIAVLPDGRASVTGYFFSSAVFGPVLASDGTVLPSIYLASAGKSDIFVARYGPTGAVEWVAHDGGTELDAGVGIAARPNGGVVVIGYFGNNISFLGPNTSTSSAENVFVAWYDAAGTNEWFRMILGTGLAQNMDLDVAALPGGGALVTGTFLGAVTFYPDLNLVSAGGADLFVALYSGGQLSWAKRAGGNSGDVGSGIATLSDGGAIVTGLFSGPATFGASEPGQTILNSAGLHDMFVARYRQDGTLVWARGAGGPDYDEGLGIAALPGGGSVVTGGFRATANFAGVNLASAGGWDIFVAQYETGIVNGAPGTRDSSFTTTQGTSLSGTLTATESDSGDTLLFYVVDQPVLGTLTLNPLTGAFVYTPKPGVTGTDTFSFIVSDGVAYSSESTVTIEVDAVPVAYDQAVSTNEDIPVSITLVATDADGDPLTYAIGIGPTHGTLSGTPPSLTYTPDNDWNGTDNFTFVANDGVTDSNTAQITVTVTPVNDQPAVGAITLEPSLVHVGMPVGASAIFTDPDAGDTHTATWDWGDGSTTPGTVSEVSGQVAGSHAYNQAGFYTVILTVRDVAGGSGQAASDTVIVYDPAAGFVTGGGWMIPTASQAASMSSGRGAFELVARYEKDASVPSGQTRFRLDGADLHFRSTSYSWLVIREHLAVYQGAGTINGVSGYGFLVAVGNGGKSDTIRIAIWEASSGLIVYDAQPGSPMTAAPTLPVRGGSIQIHD